jgi:sugar lactone lactonase YvrE
LALASGCGSGSSGPSSRRPSVTGQFAFWPVPPGDPHIQFLQSFNSAGDLTSDKPGGLSTLVFGEEDLSESAINKPYGIDMRNGRIYVCDIRRNGVVVLDLEKKQMRLVGVTGFNSLANPVDVAVAEDGAIYVADNERNAVLVFDQNERFSRVFGHDAFRPVGLALHGDRLYVCNLDAQLVEIYDRRSGEQIGTLGEVGEEDGQFRVPLGIDTDAQGNVYVVDMMRCRLQKFSPEGEFLAAVGAMGDVAGSFARPKQVAVDHDGIVYIVDAAFNNVQMFDDQFRLLMHFGAAGEFSGAMNLPAGICVSEEAVKYFADELHPGFAAERVILVTNQFGVSKVSAYALGERRPGWSIADLSANAEEVATGAGANPEAVPLQIPADATEPLGEETPAEEPPTSGQPSPEDQPGA